MILLKLLVISIYQKLENYWESVLDKLFTISVALNSQIKLITFNDE